MNVPWLKMLVTLFSKFATIGVICTLFSLGSNFVFLKYFDTPLISTYVVVYFVSILLSFVLNSHFTFQSKKSIRNGSIYYLVYFSSMLLGVVLLNICEYTLNFPKWVYPFLVIPFTMVWNFVFTLKFLRSN